MKAMPVSLLSKQDTPPTLPIELNTLLTHFSFVKREIRVSNSFQLLGFILLYKIFKPSKNYFCTSKKKQTNKLTQLLSRAFDKVSTLSNVYTGFLLCLNYSFLPYRSSCRTLVAPSLSLSLEGNINLSEKLEVDPLGIFI